MTPLLIGKLPSMRRQNLQSEFAGLRQACPEGVFVSLTPEEPTVWSAVLFVRHGPYSPGILRFHMSFPDTYPEAPPTVVFSTDIFHPLITPPTTEEERLPPGGFSLAHGFPEWFNAEKQMGQHHQHNQSNNQQHVQQQQLDSSSNNPAPSKTNQKEESYMCTTTTRILVYDVLKYIRSTFDSDEVLDSVPLEAAANPGAWTAWRTHRRKQGKLLDVETAPEPQHDPEPDADEQRYDSEPPPVPEKDFPPYNGTSGPTRATPSTPTITLKRPSQWNWDGVWEDRVKKGIALTLTESALYGAASTAGHEDLIKFLPMGESDIDSIKENIRRTLGSSFVG